MIEAAERHGVNPHLLWVIAYLETRFDPKRKSRVGARGLMQFMPAAASSYGLVDPYNPTAAIDAAAKYVRDLAARFNNRADLTLAAYNSGEGTVKAFLLGRSIKVGKRVINPRGIVTGGIPPYRETRMYVARGLQLLERLTTASFLTSNQPQSAKAIELSFQEERDLRRSVIRQSVRASTDQAQGQKKLDRAATRRSIYFVNPRSRD